jgi:guanylate kinase
VIKTKKRGNLLIISGTTCAGKGTVIKELLKNDPNKVLSVSYTSRPIRKGEKEGFDYFYITKEEFEEKIKNNDLLEYETVHFDHYYGTPKDKTEKFLSEGRDVILEIEVNGAKKIKELMPETILIFILAPSMSEVKERIKSRLAEKPEQIIKRFETAYREINEINKYNYVVVNDNLDLAVKKVEAILLSEKCRVDRIEDIYVENKEEIIHEFLMGKEFDNEVRSLTDNETK